MKDKHGGGTLRASASVLFRCVVQALRLATDSFLACAERPRESQTIPQRSDRKARNSQAQMGHGV